MFQLLFGERDLLGSGRRFSFCTAPKSTGRTRSVRVVARDMSSGFAALVHMVQGQASLGTRDGGGKVSEVPLRISTGSDPSKFR